jgi:hypothetical protein
MAFGTLRFVVSQKLTDVTEVLLPLSSAMKRRPISARLHGETSKQAVIFIVIFFVSVYRDALKVVCFSLSRHFISFCKNDAQHSSFPKRNASVRAEWPSKKILYRVA